MSSDYNRQKSFLNFIGIGDKYIYNFLDSLTQDELKVKELNLFRKYMKFYENNIEEYCDTEYCTLRYENYKFELMGFTPYHAYKYVGYIKDVYLYDTTMNWIYRIIESKMIDNGVRELGEFIRICEEKRYRVRY